MPFAPLAPLVDNLRARAGRSLEAGAPPTLARRAAAALWGAVASRGVARPLDLPEGLRAVGIGGAVLGGAGKTPVAVAVARALAQRGEHIALVSHAYRASPGCAREVRPSLDRPEEVGDDALASARLLAGDSVPVIVAPSRRSAAELARALGASVIVVDGLLQASPSPLIDAVLVLDAGSPWGSRSCPPLGDLRAPRKALLAAADHVAVLVGPDAPCSPSLPPGALLLASSIQGAASASGERYDLVALRPLRAGLIVAIARPARVLSALARCGIAPAVTIALGDHAAPSPAAIDLACAPHLGVDAWLTTARCAVKLPPTIRGAPVLALDHRVDVLPLVARLRALLAQGEGVRGASERRERARGRTLRPPAR